MLYKADIGCSNSCRLVTSNICLEASSSIPTKMAIPETCKAFRRTTGDVPTTIAPSTEQLPRELGPNDVLIKIHTVSLNFRDVAMLHGRYPVETIERGIPCSDAAAEVAAIGNGVKDFAIGDRVSVVFDLGKVTGAEDGPSQALGGDAEGVLREYAVYEDKYLVQLPKHLSWEEVSFNVSQQSLPSYTYTPKTTGSYHHLRWRHGLDFSQRPQIGW